MLLQAGLYPVGTMFESCDVRCRCGFSQRVETWRAATRIAWEHDEAHEQGRYRQAEQGQLTFEAASVTAKAARA